MKPKVFIFIGRSGCGKGTQADRLMTHLTNNKGELSETLHIESGTLLRNFVKGDNYTQTKLRSVLQDGLLVPESIIVSLWTEHIISHFTGTQNMVFDGTPRKLHESQLLDNALQFYGIEKPVVLYLNVKSDWAEKRLIERARKDDTPEAIAKRLAWFESEVVKTLSFYKHNSYYDFVEINGEQSIEDVHKEILTKLGLK